MVAFPGGINAATKSNDAPDAAPRGHSGPAQMIARRLFFPLIIIAPVAGLAAAAVIEAPKAQTAQKYLGAKVNFPYEVSTSKMRITPSLRTVGLTV